MNLSDNNKCFGCGKENPLGLKIAFTLDREGKAIKGEFTPGPEYQGYQGITHGGIIATLLDEAMGRLLFEIGSLAVTAWMEVRYMAPLAIGEKVFVCARVIKERKKFFEAVAEVTDITGAIIARASGKLMMV